MRTMTTAFIALTVLMPARALTAQQATSVVRATFVVAPVAISGAEAASDAALRASAQEMSRALVASLSPDSVLRVVNAGAPARPTMRDALPVFRIEGVLERAGRDQLILAWRLIGPDNEELLVGRDRVVQGAERDAAATIARTVAARVHARLQS